MIYVLNHYHLNLVELLDHVDLVDFVNKLSSFNLITGQESHLVTKLCDFDKIQAILRSVQTNITEGRGSLMKFCKLLHGYQDLRKVALRMKVKLSESLVRKPIKFS